MLHPFDERPVVVAIAGPNGAGKSTFFEEFVKPAGLRFVNADVKTVLPLQNSFSRGLEAQFSFCAERP